MAPPNAPLERSDLDAVVAAVGLDGPRAEYMTSRWASQTRWLDGRAGRAHRAYVLFRLVTIVGGVLLPAAVNLGSGAARQATSAAGAEQAGGALPPWIAVALGVAVAIAAAVEGFFRFGERWRHYRSVAERMKAEGWLFAERAGPYAGAATADAAFQRFVGRVEEILRGDVETFLTTVAGEKGGTGRAA